MDVLKEFVKPELLILIPVLYLVGMALKRSTFVDKYIPIVLGISGILLATIYVFATTATVVAQDILMAIFVSITQGILVAGCSVYVNQIYRQSKREE